MISMAKLGEIDLDINEIVIGGERFAKVNDKDTKGVEPKEGKPEVLAVGDKVRLKSGGDEFPLIGFENGKEYVVDALDVEHDVHGEGTKVCIRASSDSKVPGYADLDQLELVGGDFKPGDIALAVGNLTCRYVEVIADRGSGIYVVSNGSETYCWNESKLVMVSPLENRVD